MNIENESGLAEIRKPWRRGVAWIWSHHYQSSLSTRQCPKWASLLWRELLPSVTGSPGTDDPTGGRPTPHDSQWPVPTDPRPVNDRDGAGQWHLDRSPTRCHYWPRWMGHTGRGYYISEKIHLTEVICLTNCNTCLEMPYMPILIHVMVDAFSKKKYSL